MKRHLLITSLLVSSASMAQFTQSNEPAIGTSVNMYELETTADPYATFTGAGQTWDYSGYFGLTSTTRLFSMQDPAGTPEAADFPGAQKAAVIEGFMTTYLTSDASSRSSLGFSFDADALGIVNASLNTDDELLMNYPMALNDELVDIFTGTAYSPSGDFPTGGNCVSKVDGFGTLVLNSTTTYTDVLRFKLVDTAIATGVPFVDQAEIYRTQYEYYKLGSNNNLPLFVHSSLSIVLGAGGAPTDQIYVLSSAAPDGYLNVNENELTGITVYPNPVEELVSVKGLAENATLTLVDAQGKTVAAKSVEPGTASLSLSEITSGVYFLHVTSNNQTTVERVVVK